ncbi:MAG: right-handed parallel beta-helix repeat-containing protein [Myxococcales bacterium]|nr:right-handed parallel beta-helix repeat-containing protein [Myxococcales bacterium]
MTDRTGKAWVALALALALAGCDESAAPGGGSAAGGDTPGAGGDQAGAGDAGGAGPGGNTPGDGGAPTLGGAPGSGGSPPTDCGDPKVLCVGGPDGEYADLQAAADAAQPGDTVVAADGNYAGFEIDQGGTEEAPIVFYAIGNAVIDSDGPTGDGIRIQNASHIRIEGFTITGPTERCIAARGATPEAPMLRLDIRNNDCSLAGHEGFYLSEAAVSNIEGNTISQSGQDGQPRGHGIYLANAGSDGTVLRRNHIFDLPADESAGIHFNGDLSVGGDGIIEGLTVDGNVIHDLGHNALNMDGVQSSTIMNNVIYGIAAHAIRGYAIDAAEGPSGLVVMNNTIDLPTNGRAPLKLTEDGGGHIVFNNVLLTASSANGSIMVESSANLESANNAVVNRFSFDGDDGIVTLATWQAAGLDEGSFVATASLFVSPGNDYGLSASANAVDAGLDSFQGANAPASDADGTSRPVGAGIDIGAYESH